MGLKENPVVKQVLEAGEASVGRLVNQLLGNERFVLAIQSIVSGTLSAKGTLDKSLRAALATMNLPSTADVEKLSEKLDDIDRLLTELEGRIDALEGGPAPEKKKKKAKKKKAAAGESEGA